MFFVRHMQLKKKHILRRENKIFILLNSPQRESIFFELITILNIYFRTLNISIQLAVLLQTLCCRIWQNVHKESIAFWKLSLTTLLLELLLGSVQSSNWKLIGQYDYPQSVWQQSLNTENLYIEYYQ